MEKYTNSLPALIANGWLVETSNGYMLTPVGLEYYSVWSKSTKDQSEISKHIFSKTNPMEPDAIQENMDYLFGHKYICTVYDPEIGSSVTKSTMAGDELFKTMEYYIDTVRVNKDLKKKDNAVRNQKIASGLAKAMGSMTDMMVKIAKAQNKRPPKKTKRKSKKASGDMSEYWKIKGGNTWH